MNKVDKMVASQPIKRINGGSAADKKALSREALLSPAGHLSLRSSYFIRRRSRFIGRSSSLRGRSPKQSMRAATLSAACGSPGCGRSASLPGVIHIASLRDAPFSVLPFSLLSPAGHLSLRSSYFIRRRSRFIARRAFIRPLAAFINN